MDLLVETGEIRVVLSVKTAAVELCELGGEIDEHLVTPSIEMRTVVKRLAGSWFGVEDG